MTVVLSPHLDDAVLSLGQMLLAEANPIVVTVFAGIPRNDTLSDYDRDSGFRSSSAAMAARRAEDRRAMGVVGAQQVHLEFLDNQYGRDEHPTLITTAVKAYMGPEHHTFGPLGIGHPDHVKLRRAALEAIDVDGELLLYEELPYKVLWPEQVGKALEEVTASGFHVEPYAIEAGELARKHRAIARYVSQYPNGATDPCLSVPERVWRAIRTCD